MLILAQPRSASTSLTHTLAELTGRQAVRRDRLGKKVKEFNSLPHTDLIDVPMGMLKEMAFSKDVLYQQHFPPTKENLNKFVNLKTKFVITSRNPEHSFDSYSRQEDLASYIAGIKKRHGEEGLKKSKRQLANFHESYKKFAAENKEYFLYIDYETLVANQKNTLLKIIEFFKLKKPEFNTIALLKYRFSGSKIHNS